MDGRGVDGPRGGHGRTQEAEVALNQAGVTGGLAEGHQSPRAASRIALTDAEGHVTPRVCEVVGSNAGAGRAGAAAGRAAAGAPLGAGEVKIGAGCAGRGVAGGQLH